MSLCNACWVVCTIWYPFTFYLLSASQGSISQSLLQFWMYLSITCTKKCQHQNHTWIFLTRPQTSHDSHDFQQNFTQFQPDHMIVRKNNWEHLCVCVCVCVSFHLIKYQSDSIACFLFSPKSSTLNVIIYYNFFLFSFF